MTVSAKFNPDGGVGNPKPPSRNKAGAAPDTLALKAQRTRAMAATFGLFKDRNVFPGDGLAFERKTREAW